MFARVPAPLEGAGQGGGSIQSRASSFVAQCPKDAFKDHIGASQDVAAPETQDAVAARFQPRGSRRVVVLLKRVLTTIDLDDEPALGAKEVDDIAADRSLTPKAIAIERASPQSRPQPDLSVAWALPERSCPFGMHRGRSLKVSRRLTPYPPPCPAPSRGAGTRTNTRSLLGDA